MLHCDSQSAIHLAGNSAYHFRTKHINRKYHFIRALLDEEELVLQKIHTSVNPADMFTKVVTTSKLGLCSVSIGLRE